MRRSSDERHSIIDVDVGASSPCLRLGGHRVWGASVPDDQVGVTSHRNTTLNSNITQHRLKPCYWKQLLTIFNLYPPSVLWRCWLGGRKGIRPVKNFEWWGAGIVICLEWDADLHMDQLMPLPLTISCFSKSRLVLPLWYRLTRIVPPGKRAVKRVCVCVCVCVCACVRACVRVYSPWNRAA